MFLQTLTFLSIYFISESLASAVEQINREVEKLKEKQTSTGKQVTQNETDGSKTISRCRGLNCCIFAERKLKLLALIKGAV